MVILTCPNCGPRNVQEFRYGGEYNPRPKKPLEVSEATWTDYVYMRANKLGVQTEWWYHQAGCQLWFLAERHTKTNEVLTTYLWPAKVTPEGANYPGYPGYPGGHTGHRGHRHADEAQ